MFRKENQAIYLICCTSNYRADVPYCMERVRKR